MKISIVVLALTVTRVFCQIGMQGGDVDIDDQLFTCMNRCMCSCASKGYGSIMLEGNNTSSMPKSEQVTPEAVSAEPRIGEPENPEPVSEAPESEEPPSEEPESQEPVSEEPQIEEPQTPEPVSEEPISEEPQTPEPVSEEPISEEPESAEPVSEEPQSEEPQTPEPVTEEPASEEPETEEPVSEEPQSDEPETPEPVTEEPASEEPETEEPVSEEPQSDEPETPEPVTDEPVSQAPVSEQPVSEEPESEEPETPEPVTDEPETEAPESEEAGFSYNFPIKRTYTTVDPNDVITIDESPTPQQEIVYGETVDADNPLMINVAVYNYGKGEYVYKIDQADPISACDEYESGTWNDVVIRIIDTGLMPDGKCPVAAGKYTVSQNYNIPVKFAEQLDCGRYELTANVYAHDQWILQPYFEWEISDDCA